MTQQLGVKLFVARTRNRGLGNTVRLLRYHTLHVLRYNTWAKMANFAMVKADKWLRRERVRGMPFTYFIDPINICNLRCAVCPTGLGILGREQGMIDLERFKAIVDQIARYAYVLELYNWGEPFLHPGIFDMIDYAHRARISVRTSSNMNRFSAELAERTVASGLDRLIVSVDGSTQETYAKYRRGGSLSRVLENVSMLVQEKKRQDSMYPIILVRMLVNRYNEHQIAEVRQIARDLETDGFSTGGFFVDTTDPDQVAEWLPSDQTQGFYDHSADKLENVWRCSELWESMTINWDGGVAPCCWLHRQENDFDNAFVKPLAEIWNGDAFVSSRRVFARGGSKEGPSETICTVCRGRPLYLQD
jgi:MoaA/NifB/PqqE/SkfB family radical SAM enzyme